MRERNRFVYLLVAHLVIVAWHVGQLAAGSYCWEEAVERSSLVSHALFDLAVATWPPWGIMVVE